MLEGKKRRVFTTEDTESTETRRGRRKERDAVESRKLKVESQLKTRRIYRPERFGRTKRRRVLNTESAEDTETGRGGRYRGRTKRRGVFTTATGSEQAPDTESADMRRRGSQTNGEKRANGGRGRS